MQSRELPRQYIHSSTKPFHQTCIDGEPNDHSSDSNWLRPTKGEDNHSHAGTSPNTKSGNSQGSQESSRSTRDTDSAISNESPLNEGEESKEVRDHNQEVIL
jgi:hypothetical protein